MTAVGAFPRKSSPRPCRPCRKTMSTLKKAETLQDLLNIYIAYNNEYDITSLAIKANIVEPPRKLKIKKKTV